MNRTTKNLFRIIIVILLLEGAFLVYRDVENTQKNAVTHALFVGDIMLDRTVALHAEKYGTDSLFVGVKQLFNGPQDIVGNLEGTMTNNQSIAQQDNSILRFTFNPKYAGVLKSVGFSALSLANNHSLDFGEDGYTQTVSNLRNAGIVPFGSPNNNENISTKISVQGKTLCLVGYLDLFTENPTPALEEIKAIRSSCSFVVLFTHWGIEYQSTSTERQQMLAHSFIDAGADVIIGAHPHVVEPIEIYKNKAIFYSLGNFIFDQDFSFATQHGLAVDIGWNDTQTIFTLTPMTIENSQASVADSSDAQKLLSLTLRNSSLPSDIISSIRITHQFTLQNSNLDSQ